MMFVDGTWQSLPGATAISVLYEPGSTAHGYSPNQLHAVRHNLSSLYLGLDSCIILDMASLTCLPSFRCDPAQDWVSFHANITANEVKQMAEIAKTIPARQIADGNDKTLDVVVYSGYAGLGIYDPSSMDHYGDLVEKYGVNWEVLSAAGLNVAMVGYGDHDITPVLDAIAKGKSATPDENTSCPVVCGVISGTQKEFAQRYNTCAAAQGGEGYIMEYDGHHTFDNDLGFHVPGFISDDQLKFASELDLKLLSEPDRVRPMSSTAALTNNRTVMAD
jgi:hypothetical protein